MDTLGRTVALAMLRDHRERGKRLRQLRDARQLTQREAADLAGVTEKTWGSWEAGSGMKPANVRKAAEVLNVTAEEIVGEAEIPDPFSLAAHLDERVEEFRRFSYEMQDAFAEVAEKLDRQYAMLQQIFSKLATPQAAQELLEGAELLEQLAERRAAALDEASAAQAGTRRRRAG